MCGGQTFGTVLVKKNITCLQNANHKTLNQNSKVKLFSRVKGLEFEEKKKTFVGFSPNLTRRVPMVPASARS